MNDLTGKRIAVLLANSGVEQAELTTPRTRYSCEWFNIYGGPGDQTL